MSWGFKPLGELCDVLDSKRKPITKKDRIEGEYPYYGATGILSYVENYIFDEKLVLIGEDGAKWGAGENTAFSVEGKCWVNNHAHVIRPHRDTVLDQWIIYYLNATDLSPFITGLTVPKLNQEKMRSITLPIPPLPQQKRIVAILDEAFAGIDQAIANTEKNLASARELFESYLNTIFTQRGEGRNADIFSNLIDSQTIGLSRGKKEQSYNYDYPYIKMHNITNDNRFNTDDVTSVKATKEEVNKYRLECGDLLFNTRNSKELVGKNCLYIWDNEKPVLFNNNIMRIRFKPHLRGDFTAVLFDFYARSGRLESLKSGTTNVSAIYFRNLENFVLEYPICKLQQEEIAKKVRQYAGYLEDLQTIQSTKLTALEELKQSLLQKAFTGELTEDEIREEAAA